VTWIIILSQLQPSVLKSVPVLSSQYRAFTTVGGQRLKQTAKEQGYKQGPQGQSCGWAARFLPFHLRRPLICL